MKNKILNGLLLCVLALGGMVLASPSPAIVTEGTVDFNNATPSIALKDLAIGTSSDVAVSRTYAQMGVNPKTENYVLRFATAVTGPVTSATYTRTAVGFPQETITDEVTTLYAGIMADGVATYYDGNGTTTTKPETLNYYWACYLIEFETDDYIATDITVSLSVTKEDGTSLSSEAKVASLEDLLPVENTNIKLDLPTGVTVSDDYNLNPEVGSVIIAPTAEQITNTTGREIAGWFNTTKNNVLEETDTVLEGGVTLTPYFAPEVGSHVLACSGANDKRTPDYYGNFDENATGTYDKTTIGVNRTLVGDVLGRELTFNADLVEQDYWRMVSAVGEYGVYAGHCYRVHFKVQNRGTDTLSLRLIQVQGGLKVTEEEGAVMTDTLTIAPNEIKDVSIEYAIQSDNKNILTVCEVMAPATQVKVAFAMSIEEDIVLNPETKYTLTLGNGMKFADGSNTIDLAQGEKMPEVVNDTGREIIGWMYGDQKITGEFAMPAEDCTINPICGPRAGFTALNFGNEQNNSRPQVRSNAGDSTFTQTNFSATTAQGTIIHGGEDGVAQMGRVLTYTKTMPKGGIFRANTVVDSVNKVVTLNTEHQFEYNFENKGTTAIHLKLNQVNKGGDAESGDQGVLIDLQPGESMTTLIKIKFALGDPNSNALSLFTITEAMNEGMQLGVSMSCKLGS